MTHFTRIGIIIYWKRIKAFSDTFGTKVQRNLARIYLDYRNDGSFFGYLSHKICTIHIYDNFLVFGIRDGDKHHHGLNDRTWHT